MFIKMFMKKYIAISSHFLPCRYFLSGYFKCTETKASYVTLKRFKTQQTLKCLNSRVDQLSVRINVRNLFIVYRLLKSLKINCVSSVI